MMKRSLPLLFILCLLLVTPALGHRVHLFAYAADGQLHSESYFPDGRPVKLGKVEIRTLAGELLQQGETDDNGHFVCEIPREVDLELSVKASMGHRANFTISREELEQGR